MAQLHRWKEAQAELLKVVKIDRNNRMGFRLLGEVLMRRNDYDRALPVLQHAQNLNPSDSEILTLVKRAREGLPLDPPPAIPTAVVMVSAGGGGGGYEEEAPTVAAGSAMPSPRARGPVTPQSSPALGRVELQKKVVIRGGIKETHAKNRGSASRDARSGAGGAFPPVEIHKPGQPEAPLGGGAPVRPRLIPAEKPKDAAQEGLRGSAAVGEQYLNQLLMGGLLDVPNVRVADSPYEVEPGKRWGRSSFRLFVYLFVILIAAGTGGGVWTWYADKKNNSEIAVFRDEAKLLIEAGDRIELGVATEKVSQALQRDPNNVYTMALLAEITAISALLHGEYTAAEVLRAVDAAAAEIEGPADEGYREVLIGRSAVSLTELSDLGDGADARLVEVRANLSGWLERSPDDQFTRWLLGRALLAAGDRRAALDSFTKAHSGGAGPVIATVDLANFHLDEGEYDKAMSLYESALARAQTHELALAGRSLARSERRKETSEAMADISIGLAQAKGATLIAWKELALATAQYAQEDYESFSAGIAKAAGPTSPRFLARIGLARIRQGRIVDAARIRSEIRYYAADPQLNPLVKGLTVELLMARGKPQAALNELGDQVGLRASSIRGRALFDLGKASDALVIFEAALKDSPDDLEMKVWSEACRMLTTKGSERRRADEALDSLGRKSQTKTARFVHGAALAAVGNSDVAMDKLKQSVEDVTDAFPNPVAYRSYLALARLTFAAGKTEEAKGYLDKSMEHNPGYLPTLDLLGQVMVESDPSRALQLLSDVADEGVLTVGGELAHARATVKTGGDRAKAEGAIRRAKDRGAGTKSLQQAILDVNPELFAELGVPPLEAEPAP
jgi:tetratricopeptide (TPR) repeat protein